MLLVLSSVHFIQPSVKLSFIMFYFTFLFNLVLSVYFGTLYGIFIQIIMYINLKVFLFLFFITEVFVINFFIIDSQKVLTILCSWGSKFVESLEVRLIFVYFGIDPWVSVHELWFLFFFSFESVSLSMRRILTSEESLILSVLSYFTVQNLRKFLMTISFKMWVIFIDCFTFYFKNFFS